MSRRGRGKKKIPKTGILGQRGINLIERIVLEMGSRWTASGPNEIGIDGYIELFDPASGEPTGKTVAAQSKAVTKFVSTSQGAISYSCDRRDVDYWLQGNTPVVLIVSCPDAEEAYWVSIKDYFSDPARRASTRVEFVKSRDRLTAESATRLIEVGRAANEGLYLAPLPRTERLFSNLLPLGSIPPHIYVANTDIRKPVEVFTKLRAAGAINESAWILKSGQITSFHNLQEAPWEAICDAGTADFFESSEWSESNDAARQRDFVELLNRTLRSDLAPAVRYWGGEDCYAMAGSIEIGSRWMSYRSARRNSKIAVVTAGVSQAKDGRTFRRLRHLAFRGQFRRLEGRWYLEITPTYRFTQDGYLLDRFHEDRLKGIKRLEGNRAVLSVVLFWADYLRGQSDLFRASELEFGEVATFQSSVGIDDKSWSATSGDEDVTGVGPLDELQALFSDIEVEEPE